MFLFFKNKYKSLFHKMADSERISFAKFQSLPEGAKEGFYPGVLVIEKGPAKGHYAVKESSGRVVQYDSTNPEHSELRKYPITIGDSTLDDVARCGQLDGATKCKLDHGSTVRDIVGDYTNFRRDGDKVRADLTLDSRFDCYGHAVALIDRMSKKIGNSIDFDYKYEIHGEIAIARCVKLNSVDIVDAPAATNSLFEENKQPDNINRMALTKEEIAEIGGIMKTELASQLGAVESKFNTRFDEIKSKMDEAPDTGDDKDKKKKKEDDSDGEEKMSKADAHRMLLSTIREVFPTVTVQKLTDPSKAKTEHKDEYEEKFQALKELGHSDADATRFMARKHRHLYNAKFGAPTVASAKL